jgi:hypothetical protein
MGLAAGETGGGYDTCPGIEERALVSGLQGHADYTSRVRYRLLPATVVS